MCVCACVCEKGETKKGTKKKKGEEGRVGEDKHRDGIIKDRSERMKRNWKYDWERKREIKIDNESNKKTKKTKKGFCLFFAFFKKQMTCSQ